MLIQNIIEEKEFTDTVNKVIKQVGKSYKFGIYDNDDISQEIYMECLRKLWKWDKTRDLYNFLLVITKNHLINIKRNEFYRPECPCDLCDNKDDGKTGHTDKRYCERFLNWKKTNLRKANIAAPPSIPENFQGLAKPEEDKMSRDELQEHIDLKLPVKLRDIYLRMKTGNKVSNVDKARVLRFLKKILKNY